MIGRPQLWSSRLVALICFNNICHIIASRYLSGNLIPPPFRIDIGGWIVALNFARNTTAGVFMILCFLFFTDRKRFPAILLGLFFVQVLVDDPMSKLLPLHWRYLYFVPGILQAAFAGFSIYWILSEWRADLIEKRRRIRAFALVAIGLVLVGSNFLRIGNPNPDPSSGYYANESLIAVVLALLLLLLYRSTRHDFDEPLGQPSVRPVAEPPDTGTRETAAAYAKLVNLLENDLIYRNPNLDLSVLAAKVGLPEYRLRKLINEQLGHRNFNVFLHTYRVRDACQRLRDPGSQRIPILTIALSVGYQSVNTFNRGFREIMGMTPSAYRNGEISPAETGKTSPDSE